MFSLTIKSYNIREIFSAHNGRFLLKRDSTVNDNIDNIGFCFFFLSLPIIRQSLVYLHLFSLPEGGFQFSYFLTINSFPGANVVSPVKSKSMPSRTWHNQLVTSCLFHFTVLSLKYSLFQKVYSCSIYRNIFYNT